MKHLYLYSIRNQAFRVFSILLFFVFVFGLLANAQIKKTGLPLINSFPRSIYKASTQNWAIVQNSLGYIYFANNDGLLEFDGQHWTIYPVPNKSIVRSVLAVGDTIFVGAFEEFGFFAPNTEGKLTYHSLVNLVTEADRAFDEIWKIHKTSEGVLFQSFKFLFLYAENKIKAFEPNSSFGHSYLVGDDVYIIDTKNGLQKFWNGNLEVVSNDPLFINNELRCILPYVNGQLLIGFINKGVFVFDGNTLKPWSTSVNNMLIDNIVFSGIRLANGLYAFGSIQNGVYISNTKGEILQHINRFKGLLNNTVLCLFEDKHANLWLGLDNGIDYLEINSPLSIYDHTFHIESAYASLVHNGLLYVGTNQGLFYADLEDLENINLTKTSFQIVPGTEGQVWKLEVIDDQLLCGHNFGCFLINGIKAERIASDRGYWTFIKHHGKTDTIICGTYNGLTVLVKNDQKWQFANKIEGFDESSKNVVQYNDKIWIAHGYRGLFEVKFNKTLNRVENFKLYSANNGLPKELPYNVHVINNDLIFSSKQGFFEFELSSSTFYPSEKYNRIFGDQTAVDNLYSDERGNLWYFSFGKMGLLRLLEDGTYSNVISPFNRINASLIESYENVFVYNNRNVFIGSKNGLLHYDPFFKKDYQTLSDVIFREIVFSGDKGSKMLFNVNSKATEERPLTEISYDFNSASFRFATPFYESGGHSLFSYRLKGFDQNWSNWDINTFKEYTNLFDGEYVFEVKASTLNSTENMIYRFAFVVQPPFFRSTFAYVVYVIILLVLIVGNIIFVQRRIAKTEQHEKQRHSKELEEQEASFREKALISEKEIIHLRNESLRSQISHKNKELANTTLHLIHKNKILNAIKIQLNALIDSNIAQSKKSQIEQLSNKINKELKNEKFQQVFDEYFDDVHQDFAARLKKQHPELSPRELRLCAYLKMNLSTKEIAPLMNISVRGVEIGRYRLRKKLELEREENLIDYLLKF